MNLLLELFLEQQLASMSLNDLITFAELARDEIAQLETSLTDAQAEIERRDPGNLIETIWTLAEGGEQ